MLENILTGRTLKIKITVKSLVSAGVIAIAVLLPQLVHLIAGQAGGITWLPMYLPVLLGGCILGWRWGLGVGVLSPVVSFALTSLWGDPMPAAARLPFMMAELAVFAFISGVFSKKIYSNAWMAFPAVLLAEVVGRLFFLLLSVIFQGIAPFTPALIWSQIQQGLPAVVLQAVIVPLIVMGLRFMLKHER